MIVVDASAMLEVLLLTPAASEIEDRCFAPGETLHAPHLIDLEITQVLRRYCAIGDLAPLRAQEAMDDLAFFGLSRYPHDVFLPRIWQLRHNVTAYDAAYLALAEELAAPLLTCDQRLAAAPGHHAVVEVCGS